MISRTVVANIALGTAVVMVGLLLGMGLGLAQSSTPKLTPEQKVALYQARDRVNAAFEKVKATPEWAVYEEAVKQQKVAVDDARKAADPKKWKLGDDLEFTAIPEPSVPKK